VAEIWFSSLPKSLAGFEGRGKIGEKGRGRKVRRGAGENTPEINFW